MAKNHSEMTVKELRDRAKELDIKGRWDMSKAQLIEAITRAESTEVELTESTGNVGGITRTKSATEEIVNDNNEGNRAKYIENVTIGTIVAYKVSDTKAKSAKVIKKSTSDRKLLVESSYGAQSTISFDDVIWVKTGKRWPKGVYQMLRGESNAKVE